jgi:hypothetical protein
MHGGRFCDVLLTAGANRDRPEPGRDQALSRQLAGIAKRVLLKLPPVVIIFEFGTPCRVTGQERRSERQCLDLL